MHRFLQRTSARVASVAVGAAAVLTLIASPAQAAATAAFTQDSRWDTGYVGTFTVVNDTGTAVAWRVEFDLPAGTTIGTSWSAQLTRTGNHYSAAGASWNATVAPGGRTSFGFVAHGTGTPLGCRLNGAPCSGATGADLRPPSKPGNFRVTLSSTRQTLRWDASTDDVGVTGYEVYVGANLVATVTGTEYSMPIPPPAIFTYRVRALDAAGNTGPYAEITPGAPADTVPPSAPADLFIAFTSGRVTLSWPAATDNRGVTGYDVFLNGVLQGSTSGTSLGLPPLGYGVFRFEVQAVDGAGLISPRVSRALAVDPAPPLPSAT